MRIRSLKMDGETVLTRQDLIGILNSVEADINRDLACEYDSLAVTSLNAQDRLCERIRAKLERL